MNSSSCPPSIEERSPLSAEDLDRSRDRSRVLLARQHHNRLLVVWLLLGPGVLAMLGENDGPSMLSYAVSGAQNGIGFFLPFILLTFAAAYIVQEMAMRVGAVTHRGYGELIFQRYGPFWGWMSALDLLGTNVVTLITEVVAIRIGMGYFGVPAWGAVIAAVCLVAIGASGSRYAHWERFVMALAVFNLVFVVVAFLSKPSPTSIGHALLTWSPAPHESAATFLLLLCSNIGATVTPWMLFFQQSASADKGLTPRDLPLGKLDTLVGSVLAAAAGCAALVASAPLYTHHLHVSNDIYTSGFSQVLQPVIGKAAAVLFALGLIEAGAVAMLTVSASNAYAISEVSGTSNQSFNHSVSEAPLFHAANIGTAIIAGLIVLIPGVPLISVCLNANLLAVVLMPPALVFLLLFANDREIMGRYVNSVVTNVLAIAIGTLVTLAGIAYAVVAAIATLHHTQL
jgi:Mn2+/Fe2+ NRAMP family transporter